MNATYSISSLVTSTKCRVPSTYGVDPVLVTQYSELYQRPLPRRRIMNLSVRRLVRVFLPIAGLPQGVFGPGIPIGERPSPPPCGWLAGSIALPRTVGRIPIQRLRPALPKFTLL